MAFVCRRGWVCNAAPPRSRSMNSPSSWGGDDGETRQMSQRLPPARGGTCALDPGQGCVKSTDDGKLPAVIPGSLRRRIWGIADGFHLQGGGQGLFLPACEEMVPWAVGGRLWVKQKHSDKEFLGFCGIAESGGVWS